MSATKNSELLINANLATCDGNAEVPYGLIENAAVLVEAGYVAWCGTSDQLPPEASNVPTQDLNSRLLTPSLIDCHTHVVHGGNRSLEFEQRLTGKTYAEISAAGGGIVSTMNATREASVEELVASALPRIDAMLSEGVSVIEIKSGYGLDRETELNMLRAARKIQDVRPVTVRTSFLGAHAVPKDFTGFADRYIDEICIPTLQAAHAEGLVDAVDGFCESIAFDVPQIRRVFERASELGLPIKLHAEQLTLSGGTELAAGMEALSVDHLEYLDEAGVIAMSKAGSVAVLLPGAFYTLRESQLPPVELFRKHNVPIAIATDCNPGSSPMTSLLLALNMACTLFKLTPEEALIGATRNAATALGLTDCGVIGPGMKADFALWNVDHPAELAYRVGFNPLHERMNYLSV